MTRPISSRSGLNATEKSFPSRSPPDSRAGASCRRVVPMGSVVSKIQSVPRLIPRPTASAAASRLRTSARPASSTSTATANSTVSQDATAVVVSVVAVSAPSATTLASSAPSPASSGMGFSPRFTWFTRSTLTSQPTTVWPREASVAASGNPIRPMPTTATFISRGSPAAPARERPFATTPPAPPPRQAPPSRHTRSLPARASPPRHRGSSPVPPAAARGWRWGSASSVPPSRSQSPLPVRRRRSSRRTPAICAA